MGYDWLVCESVDVHFEDWTRITNESVGTVSNVLHSWGSNLRYKLEFIKAEG